MNFHLLSLLPLFLLPFAKSATTGSCPAEQKCSFSCCVPPEVCVNGGLCLSPAFVSSALHSADAQSSTSIPQQDLSAATKSAALPSLYTKYRSILTNVPLPTLGTEVPSGFTISSVLGVPTSSGQSKGSTTKTTTATTATETKTTKTTKTTAGTNTKATTTKAATTTESASSTSSASGSAAAITAGAAKGNDVGVGMAILIGFAAARLFAL